ncbi:MAG TPA: hypothetical protein VKZ60_01110 [Chloroflexota bacterium]|nr:hypothetical protein [Chloroflexota bacterium]
MHEPLQSSERGSLLPTSAAGAGPSAAAGEERRAGDDALERLIDRTLHEALQRAADLRKLSEMLTLLLQRLQLQSLRLESEIAAARAEHSRLERELAEQRERIELAAWELHQREREVDQARLRLAAELEAQRAAAREEARRIRAEAEREAAALLADAQRRRTELLASLPRSELAGEALPAPPAAAREGERGAETGPALPSAPAAAEAATPAAAPLPTAAEVASTEVVFLRVPDARTAATVEAAIRGLAGVRACTLREFERGRLVLDVEHVAGLALSEDIRALESIDVRLTSAREHRLEFQWL